MTVDMTNNRVPYGLLTDEEKAALHNHYEAGGNILVFVALEREWHQKSAQNVWPNLVYRTAAHLNDKPCPPNLIHAIIAEIEGEKT
jgi:hypothetical protein